MLYWNVRCLWAFSVAVLSLASETFEEKLTIHTLHDGKVASRFSFATLLEGAAPRNPQNLSAEDDSQHYTLFPLTLGQILREYAVTELHLTLNAGKWDYTRWGHPAEPDVATGAELWAWMGDGAEATIDERWRAVRNQLAGLFCASLGSLDELRTTAPDQVFAPRGGLQNYTNTNTNNHAIRHASLPSEHVCSENLTPFLKLLPCKSLSGIAHSRLVAAAAGPDSSPESTFENKITVHRTLHGSTQSHGVLAVRLTNPSAATVEVAYLETLPWIVQLCFVPQLISKLIDLFSNNFNSSFFPIAKTPINYLNQTMQTRIAQTNGLPKYLSPISTPLRYTRIVPSHSNTSPKTNQTSPIEDLLRSITYTPPVPHSRATTFRAVVALPPRSTVHLSMGIAKAFRRYTEHPPDAQRGWDLPAGVVVGLPSSDARNAANSSFNRDSNGGVNGGVDDVYGDAGTRIYTPTLLVDLSTPDFSMPYNVIIFSSSLVAFIFGSIFNLLTRKFVVLKVEGDK
ncbi:Gpi16 subunit, GPI transamidase component-domain-containing protein [Mycena rebaudengoi]|nr:Gpi16 subunit, GPI transamidase component-domain-containing protein [Mycena rebaudengoi]